MDQPLTNSEKVLLAAMELVGEDASRSFTAEELSVRAWELDKESFGLRSFEGVYPDSNKLFKSIDSKGGLVAKGFITKVGDRTFRLTAAGMAAGSRIRPTGIESQIKAERELAAAVNKLISHPVFAEWLADRSKPNRFSRAGQFWGVAPGTPSRVVRDRLAAVRSTLNQALQYMDSRGVNALYREKDRVLCERTDIVLCLECDADLRQRFSKELSILLG